MKRMLSLATALVLCMGAVSCGKKKATSDSTSSNNSRTVTLASYNAAKIEMGDDFSSVLTLCDDPKSGDILIFGELTSGDWGGYITTKDFSDYTRFVFDPEENETVISAAMLGFGKKGILTCKEDSTLVHIIGNDGTEEKILDLGELLTPSDNGFIYGKLFKNGDGYVIGDCYNTIHSFDKDSNYLGEADLDGMNVMGLTGNADGGVTVLFQNPGDSGCMAEIEGTELINQRKCKIPGSSALTMCTGIGDTVFAGIFIDGLYIFQDDKWTKLSDLTSPDYSVMDISGIVMTGDREFAVVCGSSALNLLTEQDISELKSKKIVTLAVYGGMADELRKLADRYNRTHSDSEYRIELVQYIADENTSYQQIMDNMKMDVITGKAPDIIVDFIDGIDPSVYYVDLNEYLKDDPELNSDDFLPGFLDAISIDGKVPMIFPCFSVETLMGKTRFVGDKENWSYDEFIEALESMPEDMEVMYGANNFYKATEYFGAIVNTDEFVDYDKGTCNFDSPEYIKMMKFFKENHLGMTQDEYDKKYGGATFILWDNDKLGFRNNKKLLGPDHSIFNSGTMTEILHGAFDEPVTFVGFPSLNGQGGRIYSPSMRFSIMKTSKYPDGAWDFIKTAFSDEAYENYYEFPVLEDKFVEIFNKYLEVFHYENGDYETKLPQGEYFYDDECQKFILYDALTQEEADRCMEYVKSCAKNYRRYENDLQKIIDEELDEYFNSDKSAEETAAMIQNRASIYLSETYG